MPVPFATLRFFEAAARHGSFKLAAAELNVTPSAVSHAVRELETALGLRLFERRHRGLVLSQDGLTLRQHLVPGFDLIREGLAIVSRRRARTLRLHAAPSFAAQWLTPRLARFLRLHPEMDIKIAASTDYTRFGADEFDADIVNGPPAPGPFIVLPLGEEPVLPLCAPALAARIAAPADLMALPLINGDRNLVTWAAWCARNGLAPPKGFAMRFDRTFMSIAAAVDGLGVALESARMAERELADGRLVSPLSGQLSPVPAVLHSLVYPSIHANRPIIRAFAAWLEAELALA